MDYLFFHFHALRSIPLSLRHTFIQTAHNNCACRIVCRLAVVSRTAAKYELWPFLCISALCSRWMYRRFGEKHCHRKSQKSPTARLKIPTDHKPTNKTRNLTKSKCPQISLQLPNTNVTLRTDTQQCWRERRIFTLLVPNFQT